MKLIDEVGNRYGRLEVIRREGTGAKPTIWLCRCDCGNETVVRGGHLRGGQVASCGCLQRDIARALRTIDETGNRYGRLVVLESAGTIREKAMWFCECDCGKKAIVQGVRLRRGHTKSCGCILYRPPDGGVAASHALLQSYKAGAIKRGYQWALTEEDFIKLTSQLCHYCGAQPTQIKQRYSGDYLYNGLDRKDNSLGYLLENVVPCCWACNSIEGARSHDALLAWVKRVYEHRRLGG